MRRRQALGAIVGIGALGIGHSELGNEGPFRSAAADGPSATVRWTETYARSGSWTLESAVRTDDGGTVVCGWEARTEPFTGEAVVAKIDDDGNIDWETTVSGDADTYALWDITDIDGGFAAIGGREVIDRDDVREKEGAVEGGLVVVFDEQGNEQWRQVLRSDLWVYSTIGIGDRVVIGRDDEFRQFYGRYDQGRSVSIDESFRDGTNDFVTSQPEGLTLHDGRLYAACTRNEGFRDDEGRLHVPHRDPMVLEMTTDPIRIVNTYRFTFEEYHWTSDLVVRDDGIYVAGVRSVREQFIRDPDLEGWLMCLDHDGDRDWYETVSDENGLRFTGITTAPARDAVVATGQTLNHGRAYLASVDGDAIDRIYEQEQPGHLSDVARTTRGAALLAGATDGDNDDPFAASIAVDPDTADVRVEFSPESPSTGETVRFTVHVDNGWSPTAIEWGADVEGTGEHIEAVFEESGTYTVEATVRNEAGGRASVDASVTVSDSEQGTEANDDDDSVPGFGLSAALVGVAGGVGALYGRTVLGDDRSN